MRTGRGEDQKDQNEKVKEWLWRYREAKKDVRRLEAELEELCELQKSIRAIQYSDMPKGSHNQSDLSDYMVKQEKLWRKIHKARYRRIMVFQETKNVIDRLPTADEREVMSLRYLKSMNWEEVYVKIGYGRAQTHRYHARALQHIHKILKDEIE